MEGSDQAGELPDPEEFDVVDAISNLPDALAQAAVLMIAAANARQCLLGMGRARFGEPSNDYTRRLDAIEDLQRLVRMTIQMRHAKDWDELLAVE